MKNSAAPRIPIMTRSPVLCAIFFVNNIIPRRILIVNAKNPPRKLGSSHVETSRFMCGS